MNSWALCLVILMNAANNSLTALEQAVLKETRRLAPAKTEPTLIRIRSGWAGVTYLKAGDFDNVNPKVLFLKAATRGKITTWKPAAPVRELSQWLEAAKTAGLTKEQARVLLGQLDQPKKESGIVFRLGQQITIGSCEVYRSDFDVDILPVAGYRFERADWEKETKALKARAVGLLVHTGGDPTFLEINWYISKK